MCGNSVNSDSRCDWLCDFTNTQTHTLEKNKLKHFKIDCWKKMLWPKNVMDGLSTYWNKCDSRASFWCLFPPECILLPSYLMKSAWNYWKVLLERRFDSFWWNLRAVAYITRVSYTVAPSRFNYWQHTHNVTTQLFPSRILHTANVRIHSCHSEHTNERKTTMLKHTQA